MTNPDRRKRHLILAATAVLAGLAGACSPMEPSGDVATGPATGEAVKIQAGDNFFKPEAVTLTPGEKVTVEIVNAGTRPHDWTIDALGVSTGTMEAGDVMNATFTVPDADVEFVCTLHAGMDGTIQVS